MVLFSRCECMRSKAIYRKKGKSGLMPTTFSIYHQHGTCNFLLLACLTRSLGVEISTSPLSLHLLSVDKIRILVVRKQDTPTTLSYNQLTSLTFSQIKYSIHSYDQRLRPISNFQLLIDSSPTNTPCPCIPEPSRLYILGQGLCRAKRCPPLPSLSVCFDPCAHVVRVCARLCVCLSVCV